MLHYAVVFFVIAIIAAVLGFSGIAGAASNIAWILFVVFLILAVISLFRKKGESYARHEVKRPASSSRVRAVSFGVALAQAEALIELRRFLSAA